MLISQNANTLREPYATDWASSDDGELTAFSPGCPQGGPRQLGTLLPQSEEASLGGHACTRQPTHRGDITHRVGSSTDFFQGRERPSHSQFSHDNQRRVLWTLPLSEHSGWVPSQVLTRHILSEGGQGSLESIPDSVSLPDIPGDLGHGSRMSVGRGGLNLTPQYTVQALWVSNRAQTPHISTRGGHGIPLQNVQSFALLGFSVDLVIGSGLQAGNGGQIWTLPRLGRAFWVSGHALTLLNSTGGVREPTCKIVTHSLC